MNRDTVIALAREAHGAMLASGRGMYLWHGEAYAGDVQDFCERFANLIEEHLTYSTTHSCHPGCTKPPCVAMREAVLAEREACAKVVEETDLVDYEHCMVLHTDGHATLKNAAAAIRSRT